MRSHLSLLALFSLFFVGCSTETVESTAETSGSHDGDSADHDAEGSADHDGHDHGEGDAHTAGAFALSGSNTQVLFTGTKKSGDSHSGGFKSLTGEIALTEGGIGAIQVVIETASLFSDADRLTGHLKNEDFFSVNEFPELKFESSKIEGEGDVTVTGTLTMHGQTAEISFPAAVTVADDQVSLAAEFKVDRTKFGMNYTGKPDDPINADVDIKIIVGAEAAAGDAASAAE